jgi:KUP system potassium uptake protein
MLTSENKRLASLSIGALGVVYGDLGTSPLYALQQVLPIDEKHIFGVLSLVFWSLILVISTRYVTIFLRADNDGEGGLFALLSLLKRKYQKLPKWIFLLGIIGAGLLLGDGMITPAISVISAMEGLKVISPEFSYLIRPLSLVILLCIFICQHYGIDKIGHLFGPVILCWFVTIAILGGASIYNNPSILKAINPYYAFEFFYEGGWKAYILLSGIFLVVTGAEAMYTDLGQFGKTPIRIGWFTVALPCLLLNYFGQGAYLLQNPKAISNLFYMLAPTWFYYPLLFLATLATIIASQAIISASFSLINQAILLNVCPHLSIIHTSKMEKGQVYIPQVNFILCVGTLLLVIGFKTSDALAGAYGIAVNLVMIIVAVLVITVAHSIWKWSVLKIFEVFSLFVLIDLAFFGANFHKIFHGGWIPLAFAAFVGCIFFTWKQGTQLLRSSYFMKKSSVSDLITHLKEMRPNAADDLTAIFIADPEDQSGGSLLHYLELSRTMPKQILILSTVVENYPMVQEAHRFDLKKLSEGIHRLTIHYGFMQAIDVPQVLELANHVKLFPFYLDLNKVYFLIEVVKVASPKKKQPFLMYWQKKLFIYLLHNSERDVKFFHLPHDKTIAVGSYCQI